MLPLAFCVSVCLSVPLAADCPSSDLTGDCFVDLQDLAVLAGHWLTAYGSTDLAAMASEWLAGQKPPLGMAYIPGGTFQMGDSLDGWSSALPVHSVTLSP